MRRSIVVTLLAVVLASPAPVLAGRFPLLMNTLNIGAAKSLPLVEFAESKDVQTYVGGDLVAATLALLGPEVPVMVRLETLRRAAILSMYHEQVARTLMTRLIDRAVESKRARRPDALAFADAAYMRELLRGADMITGLQTAGRVDGSAWMDVAISLRPGDPALEFAAARISYAQPHPVPTPHDANARAGAARDPLIAANLHLINPEPVAALR